MKPKEIFNLMKTAILMIVVILFVKFSFAQDIQKDKLDLYFKSLVQNNKFMGGVSVFHDGKEIYRKSVGYADMNLKLYADKDTKYSIGSISKTFTAVMILKAIESGKLSLNQTLDNFFPLIKNSDKITIEQMMQHHSGIFDFAHSNDYFQWNTKYKTRKEMLSLIEKNEIVFESGSTMGYSNSNYLLLSYILEDIYNKPFTKILYKEIIEPLNLENTSLSKKKSTRNNNCESYSYLEEWQVQTHTNPHVFLGAGGIVSTPYDINKFAYLLFTKRIISENSLKQMLSFKDNVGFGLYNFPFYGRSVYGHGGRIDGFESFFGYLPDEKFSFAIVSNGINYELNNISIAILCSVFDIHFDIPDFTSFDLSTEDLDKYLGVYSCSELPIKMTITKNGKVLVAQGDGQPKINLEAVTKDKFRFYPGRIEIEFKPGDNSLILKQGNAVFVMKKE